MGGSIPLRPTGTQLNHAAQEVRRDPGAGHRTTGRITYQAGGRNRPSQVRAQHNLLFFPGGDSAVPKTALAFHTIPTEIAVTLENWGGGSGGPAQRACLLWPCGRGAPGMPVPALAGQAGAASSPPSLSRCPLPLAAPRSPGGAGVGAAERLRIQGESCCFLHSSQRESRPHPTRLLFWIKHWGLELQCSGSLYEE